MASKTQASKTQLEVARMVKRIGLEVCHDQFAGAYCVDGPDGCCVTCGVAMTTCEACSGIGYHTATCAEA